MTAVEDIVYQLRVQRLDVNAKAKARVEATEAWQASDTKYTQLKAQLWALIEGKTS